MDLLQVFAIDTEGHPQPGVLLCGFCHLPLGEHAFAVDRGSELFCSAACLGLGKSFMVLRAKERSAARAPGSL